MKRKLNIAVLVVALWISFLAASFAQEPTATIRFMSFQPADVIDVWNEQFAEFEGQTGIRVVHEFVPSAQTIQQVLIMAASDTLPDVIMISAQWHRALAIRGLFLELEELGFETLDVNDFWPNLLNAYTHGGHIYGFPTDLDLQLAFYNRDLFDEAGIAYPEPGWTWDDYLRLAEELSEGEGVGRIYGSTAPVMAVALMVAWSYGGDLYDPETGQPTLDSPAGERAMDFLGTLYENQLVPAPESELEMTTGRIAMGLYGPWASWYIFRDAPFDWGVVPIPRATEQTTLAWGSTMAIFSASDEVDAARQFVEFFLSPEMQFQRARDWAWFPPGESATQLENFMDDTAILNMDREQKQFVIDSVEFGRAPHTFREQARIANIFSEEIGLVAAGDKTMEQAIQDISARWAPLLQE